MFNIERWQEIFQAIAKNKLRTFLTGLSVASGIFILVILLGLAKGLENGIREEMAGSATTQIWVSPGTTSKEYKGLNPSRMIQFRMNDYILINNTYNEKFELKSPVIMIDEKVFLYGKEISTRYSLRGVTSDGLALEASVITQGRDLNRNDELYTQKNVVIGNKIKEDLFKNNNPIGEYIYISSIPFKVVGVYTNPQGNWKEEMAFVPITTVAKTFAQADKINSLAFTMRIPENPNNLVEESDKLLAGIRQTLEKKHAVAQGDESAFYIHSSVENSKTINTLLFAINTFFWWIGICTIIAGVVGVSNIMMIVVKERTKEIGIRKALGAKPISIIAMILQESVFLTTISGFVGLISGLVLLELISQIDIHPMLKSFQVDFQIATNTLILLIVTGTIAGYIPARKAANIKPIDALKDE